MDYNVDNSRNCSFSLWHFIECKRYNFSFIKKEDVEGKVIRNGPDEFGIHISWGINDQLELMSLGFASTLPVRLNP